MRFAKVYLEITNVCNRSCSFCPKTARPAKFMPEKDFTAILDRLRGWTEYLYFHLMGEPLLHPALPRYLELARERGFRVILTTNGTLLPHAGEDLLRARACTRSTSRFSPSRQMKRGTLKIMSTDASPLPPLPRSGGS